MALYAELVLSAVGEVVNEYLWTAAGFGLLIVGAEALVHGAVAVARRLRADRLT